MSLLGQEAAVDVFQCSNCGQFNSSLAERCKQCLMTFTEQQKQSAILNTKMETRQHNMKYYKNILLVGILMFIGGAILSFVMLLAGRISLWMIILTFLGIGQIFWGARGLMEEKRARL